MTKAHAPAVGESVALLALLTSLIALAIDAVLPALPQIGHSLAVEDPNQLQWIIGALFFGLSIGQIIYGPLSDSYGRKPSIYLGLVIFIIGTLVSAFAQSFEVMLLGRVIQGIGASGPKVVSIALVRDQYKGAEMARIMSFIMAVFILVPALAPSFGYLILTVSGWREIFFSFLALSGISLIWFGSRQPETLPAEKRIPFTLGRILAGTKETVSNKTVRRSMLAAGMIFGAFISYLSTVQPLFQDIFAITDQFPLYFALLALSIGCASLLNSRLVTRLGMERISVMSLQAVIGLSILFTPLLIATDGKPPLLLFMLYMAATFLCIGMLFGNLNAMAMNPMGHIAGIAAAVIGSGTTLISVVIGGAIGQLYNGTLFPLTFAFALLSLVAYLLIRHMAREKIKPKAEA